MASNVEGVQGSYHACKCLNIRVRPSHPKDEPPDVATTPEYTQVYVAEDGITVAHPQLTLRTRTRGIPIAGTSRCSRYTSLTCLVCQVLVYRVSQIIPVEVEGKDGPLIPTEDWVEQEVMKSTSGWIEVHKGCLTTEDISRRETSPEYSALFNIILPAPSSSPPIFSEPNFERPSSPPPSPLQFLANMRPLFPPPPFTPTHPVFKHLSSIAVARSAALRSAAEEDLARLAREKIAGIEADEDQLRKEVESLWKKFKEGVHNAEQDRNPATSRSPVSRQKDGFEGFSGTNGTGSPKYGTPIFIRDFVPPPVVPKRTSQPGPVSRISSLSASLATSEFHHPRHKEDRASPPPRSTRSPTSNGSHSPDSLRSSSSITLASRPAQTEGSSVLQFKRNNNDSINTAASYKYFMNLEEEMARHKREESKAQNKQPKESGHGDQASQAGPSTSRSGSNTNGPTEKKKTKDQAAAGQENVSLKDKEPETKVAEDALESRAPTGASSTSKGKRKVTFDVQPAVVTIDAGKEQQDAARGDAGEMVFHLEDEDGDRPSEEQSRPVLPLIEQPPPVRPSKTRYHRKPNTAGLPASFAGLRPASLPGPSQIRPPRSQQGADSSSSMILPSLLHHRDAALSAISPVSPKVEEEEEVEEDEPLSFHEAEIMKLVAANTPSHRGAWKKDSPAWKTFIRRSKDHPRNGDNSIEEDDDGDDILRNGVWGSNTAGNDHAQRDNDDVEDNDSNITHTGIPGSMPIPVSRLFQPREALSLASYRPPSNVPEAAEDRPASSTAARKAVYAERDRSRSMDPGALDFPEEGDDEGYDDDESAELDENSSGLGQRGRQRALKILQARSELPEAGMWRSLA